MWRRSNDPSTVMEERVRSFYASWGSTLKGEDDIRRISAELVAGDGAVLDAFNSRLRARFHGTCLSSTPVSPSADNIIIPSVIGILIQKYITYMGARERSCPRLTRARSRSLPHTGGNRGKKGRI